MKRASKVRLGAVTATTLIIFTGCGTVSNADGPTEINVATSNSSRPLSWESSEGEILGYEPEILRAIDEQLEEYTFNLTAVDDAAGETGLGTGQYDVLAQALSKSPEREEQFLFTEQPTGLSLMRIYVREDSSIETMEDLEGQRIVPVTAGGGVYRFVSQWEEQNPGTDLQYKTSGAGVPFPKLLQQVADGTADALILPSNLGQSQVIEERDLAVRATEPVDQFETYFMLGDSPDNEELARAMSDVLLELRESGRLSDLSIEFYEEDIFEYMTD